MTEIGFSCCEMVAPFPPATLADFESGLNIFMTITGTLEATPVPALPPGALLLLTTVLTGLVALMLRRRARFA